MTLSGLLFFAGIYLVAVASPGPAIAFVVARSLGRGLHALPWFVAGFVIGDLILMALAASGLAFVAQTFETAFHMVRYAGAAYLCWMAWKIWHAPVAALDISGDLAREKPLSAFLSSLSLTMGNPKPIVFFISIMPLVVDMTKMDALAFAEVAAAMVLVFTPVLVATAVLANRARKLFRSERALKRINRGTATVMAGAAIAIAAR
jgi:threonine/homoserine/homoserine lactone efflux protein